MHDDTSMSECLAEVVRGRGDFPILDQSVKGHPLVYLDNGATTQIPEPVLREIVRHYHTDNANVHRGIHTLSGRSTAALEAAREKVRAYLNAERAEEIVFTKGTTDSLNMLARSMEARLGPGDAVVVSALEHHANFVPWQQLCLRTGARFLVAPLDEAGDVDLEAFGRLLDENQVAVVAMTHVSNVTGTVNPVARITRMVHDHGALMVVDAAQSIRHEKVDVREIECDFLAFSGHKMCAPTGIGVLYGRFSEFEKLDPVEFGGEMVDIVTTQTTTFEALPLRFEAGTPNYVGARALGAAVDYLEGIGRDAVCAYEHELLAYAEERLAAVEGLRLLGHPAHRAGCLSFAVENVHPFDLAALLDTQGIALRSGNQCAQPLLHEAYGIQNITRLSPAFYNTRAEIDACVTALERVIPLLQAAAR